MKVKSLTSTCRFAAAVLLTLSGVLTVRADYSNTVATSGSGPLGYWRFNETGASPALNKIANSGSLGASADGYVVGLVTNGQSGIAGKSILLVNAGSVVGNCGARVDVPYTAALNPTPPFSIEVWFNLNSYAGADDTGWCIATSLNSNGNSGASRQGWVLYVNGTGRVQWFLGLTSGYAGQLRSGGIASSLGTWYHVVGTYDGSTMTMYFNGTQVGTTNAVGWAPNPQADLRIGGTELTGGFSPASTRPAIAGTSVAGNRGFDGFIDEVAIYTNVLSAATAKAHFDAASTNNAGYGTQILADSPIAFWRMEENTVTPPTRASLPIAANSGSVGSAVNGTNEWGTLAAQPGPAYTGFGAGNNAAFFDGQNGSIGLPDDPGLHFSGNITLMAWVKPNQRDYFRNIIAHGLDGARAETFLRISRSDDGGGGGTFNNYYEVGASDGTANTFYDAAIFQIPEADFSNWVFLAGTYDSVAGTWNLYRNGVLASSVASTHGAIDITNRWSIGSRSDPNPAANPTVNPQFFTAAGNRFGGYMDEPAIFSTTLSASDINTIYTSALVPPTISRAVQNPGTVFKGSSASFSVWAQGNPTLSYLWLSNGVSTGITTTNATINNFAVGNPTIAVAVSNPYGNTTSSVTFAVVAAPPSFTLQPKSASLYSGRPFAFYVATAGSTPLSVQWKTNGVPIPGATSTTYSGTASAAVAATYICTASNEVTQVDSLGATLTVLPAPTGYAGTIYADNPVAYWRLGESVGPVAHDYYGGRDGTYTGAQLAQSGYSALDSDTAVTFNGPNSYVGNISPFPTNGINFQGHTNFTIEAWVNGSPGQPDESTIMAKGTGASGTSANEQFSLDVSSNPGNGGEPNYHFYTRGGGNVAYEAFADIGPDGTWHHVVGVYDDLNVLGQGTNLLIFVNGELRGTGATRPTGIRASTLSPSIGSKHLGNSTVYDGVFSGTVDEVAAYPFALTFNQISNHYALPYGTSTKPTITKEPISLTVYEGFPAKLDMEGFGTQPLTFQWSKTGVGPLSDGGSLVGASTRKLVIDPVATSDSGTYSASINNSVGPLTNTVTVTLTVISAPTGPVNVPGLVLHMPFDGNLFDTSGHGNNGSGLHTTLNTTNPATPAGTMAGNPDFFYNLAGDSLIGQSLHYHTYTTNGMNSDVTNAYFVTLGDKPDFHFSSNVNFSVAYWIKFPPFNGVGDLGDLPFFDTALNSYGGAGFTFAPSYDLGSWSYSLNGAVQLYGGQFLLDDGIWHHLAHTFDRSGFAITYLDGRQVDTRKDTTAGDLDTGHPVTIGQDPSGHYPEEGYYDIDQLGVWRRSLTQLEVVGMYLADKSGFGYVDITPTISKGPGAGQVTVTWQAGTLQQSSTVNGTYTDTAFTSPYTFTPSGQMFFRTRQ